MMPAAAYVLRCAAYEKRDEFEARRARRGLNWSSHTDTTAVQSAPTAQTDDVVINDTIKREPQPIPAASMPCSTTSGSFRWVMCRQTDVDNKCSCNQHKLCLCYVPVLYECSFARHAGSEPGNAAVPPPDVTAANPSTDDGQKPPEQPQKLVQQQFICQSYACRLLFWAQPVRCFILQVCSTFIGAFTYDVLVSEL